MGEQETDLVAVARELGVVEKHGSTIIVAALAEASASIPQLAFHSAAGRWVLAIAVLGSGMAFLDGDRRQRRAARARPRPARGPRRPAVDDHRLHAHPRVVHPARRLARRPLRPPTRLPDRDVVWFAVASPLCGVAPTIELLDRRARAPGRRRRAAHPGQPGHHRGLLQPEDRAAGDRRMVRPRRRRERHRTVPRRLPRRRGELALGLPLNLPLAAIVVAHRPAARARIQRPDAPRHLDLRGAMLGALGLAGPHVRAHRGSRRLVGRGHRGGAASASPRWWRSCSSSGAAPHPMVPLGHVPLADVHRRQRA